jgi:type VII secretion integral membrane protein EccD
MSRSQASAAVGIRPDRVPPEPGRIRPDRVPPEPGRVRPPAPAPVNRLGETSRFCRVSVLAPRARLDLALPTDLTVAELVPMLCELAGESGPRSGRPLHPAAWCLAAVAGAELPPDGDLASLGVLDGDLLRLRRRADAPAPPVFDDPVDAVAEVVPPADAVPESRGTAGALVVRPWTGRSRRLGGLTAAGVATLLGAALLAATRGPNVGPVAAVVAGLAAAGAVAVGARIRRVDRAAGVLLVLVAVPLAAACGFAAVPGTPGAGHVLLAAALAAAAAAGGLAVLDEPEPVLVGAVSAATVCALAALLATFDVGPPAGLAAVAAALAIGSLPLLPRLSVRLAGLPAPVVPTTPEEMVTADAQWQLDSGEDVARLARLAHIYLGGLVIGAAVLAAGGAAVAAVAGGGSGAVFAAVAVAVLLLRSRSYATALASGAPLLAGLAAGVGLVAGLAEAGSAGLCLVCAVLLVGGGAAAVALVWSGGSREASPVARKAVDVLEAGLVIAAFPIALWVLDLYRAVQGL